MLDLAAVALRNVVVARRRHKMCRRRSGLAVACDALADRPDGAAAVSLFLQWGILCVPHLSVAVAQSLLDAPAAVARSALDRLAEARLVEPAHDDRYRMHDLVRLYALERGRSQIPLDDQRQVLQQARCHYLTTARRARDLLRVNSARLADEFVADRWIH